MGVLVDNDILQKFDIFSMSDSKYNVSNLILELRCLEYQHKMIEIRWLRLDIELNKMKMKFCDNDCFQN